MGRAWLLVVAVAFGCESQGAALDRAGIDYAAIDTSADPCTDFYQYACGRFIAETTLSADQSRWSRAFSPIAQRAINDVRDIVREAVDQSPRSEEDADIQRLYSPCVDEQAIERRGIGAFDPLLGPIQAARDLGALLAALPALMSAAPSGPFSVRVGQDVDDARRGMVWIGPAGIGLSRARHTDAGAETIRARYLVHIERVLAAGGAANAAAMAAQVFELEHALVMALPEEVDSRDPKSDRHPMDRAGLRALAPRIPWDAHFAALGLSGIDRVNVSSPEYLKVVDDKLGSVPLAVWASALRFYTLDSWAPWLTRAFSDEAFDYSSVFTGRTEMSPRYATCLYLVESVFPEPIGKRFLERRFSPQAREQATRDLQQIAAGFSMTLDQSPWLDAGTRAEAQQKLGKMEFLVGYPDKSSTVAFTLEPDLSDSLLAFTRANAAKNLSFANQVLDRREWTFKPTTVNAFYTPTNNSILLPAGILQTPLYAVEHALPVNLGAMGSIMGHELTHGFDDRGSQFDGDGNLRDWWAPAARVAFNERAQCMVDQAGRFAVAGQSVDGKLTLGENIADLGGLSLAWRALHQMSDPTQHGVGGFTDEQLFFLAFGQQYCEVLRPELERSLLESNPHAPARFRVNGPLSNLPAFTDVFQCPAGSPMRASSPCQIW